MGNGLQGGGALIGKPHAHKESSLLQEEERDARCHSTGAKSWLKAWIRCHGYAGPRNKVRYLE